MRSPACCNVLRHCAAGQLCVNGVASTESNHRQVRLTQMWSVWLACACTRCSPNVLHRVPGSHTLSPSAAVVPAATCTLTASSS